MAAPRRLMTAARTVFHVLHPGETGPRRCFTFYTPVKQYPPELMY